MLWFNRPRALLFARIGDKRLKSLESVEKNQGENRARTCPGRAHAADWTADNTLRRVDKRTHPRAGRRLYQIAMLKHIEDVLKGAFVLEELWKRDYVQAIADR
jgi:hypothetical protein